MPGLGRAVYLSDLPQIKQLELRPSRAPTFALW